jgi:hypothetical protein
MRFLVSSKRKSRETSTDNCRGSMDDRAEELVMMIDKTRGQALKANHRDSFDSSSIERPSKIRRGGSRILSLLRINKAGLDEGDPISKATMDGQSRVLSQNYGTILLIHTILYMLTS